MPRLTIIELHITKIRINAKRETYKFILTRIYPGPSGSRICQGETRFNTHEDAVAWASMRFPDVPIIDTKPQMDTAERAEAEYEA